MARHLPALRASGNAVARQDIPVLAGDQRDPSRCPSGARPEAYDARARHTGFKRNKVMLYNDRTEGYLLQ